MSKIFNLYNNEIQISFSEANHSYWLLDKNNLKKDSTPKKKRLVGVTTVIDVLGKPALINWAVDITVGFLREHIELLRDGTISSDQILEDAKAEAERIKEQSANIGNIIHQWCSDYINGKKPAMPEDEQAVRGCTNFLDWVNEYNVKFLWSEKIVYSKKYGYVGTADIGAMIKNKKYLIDIKTGNALYPEVKLQTGAYLKALVEESAESYAGRWALRISKENEQEYMARMGKKKYLKVIPPYAIFEAIFLDSEPDILARDFENYLACLMIYNWKKTARKEMS